MELKVRLSCLRHLVIQLINRINWFNLQPEIGRNWWESPRDRHEMRGIAGHSQEFDVISTWSAGKIGQRPHDLVTWWLGEVLTGRSLAKWPCKMTRIGQPPLRAALRGETWWNLKKFQERHWWKFLWKMYGTCRMIGLWWSIHLTVTMQAICCILCIYGPHIYIYYTIYVSSVFIVNGFLLFIVSWGALKIVSSWWSRALYTGRKFSSAATWLNP